MPKNFIKYFSTGVALSLSVALSAQEQSVVRLANDQLELGWKKGAGGYALETLKGNGRLGCYGNSQVSAQCFICFIQT